jgi:hypothetical protein
MKNIITKEQWNKLTEEEKIYVTNGELITEDTPYVEENINLKPIENLWNDVYQKIKWINKPKKSHPHFDSIYEGLIKVYGKSLGSDLMRILMDIIEVEYHVIYGKRVEFFDIIYNRVNISMNQWKTLIERVNIPLSNVSNTSLKIQRVKSFG